MHIDQYLQNNEQWHVLQATIQKVVYNHSWAVLPMQVIPSPVYPGLHVHLKLPTVLLQAALELHPPFFVLHSSISALSQINTIGHNITCKNLSQDWSLADSRFYRATAKHTQGIAVEILSVCLSVRPSVCLSNAWIVTKRKHLVKKVQLWLIVSRLRAFQPVSYTHLTLPTKRIV